MSLTLIAIAAVDVPFELAQHRKQLKMTKQEVKDEMKDTEGKPEVKSRIRRLQQEMAQRRMMGDVPDADVVITNPDHYSVAIRYREAQDGVPVVLAKGADQIALKIREIAVEHGVEIVRTPPLARALFHTAEVGDDIPSDLYLAVAQVLAYVFQLRQFRAGAAERPPLLQDIELPEGYDY